MFLFPIKYLVMGGVASCVIIFVIVIAVVVVSVRKRKRRYGTCVFLFQIIRFSTISTLTGMQ